MVNGVEAEETVTWESGDVREVDLTFEGVPDDGGSEDGSDSNDDGGSSSGGGGGTTDGGGEESASGGGGGGGGGGGIAPADDTETEAENAEPDVEVVHEENTEIEANAETPQAKPSPSRDQRAFKSSTANPTTPVIRPARRSPSRRYQFPRKSKTSQRRSG